MNGRSVLALLLLAVALVAAAQARDVTYTRYQRGFPLDGKTIHIHPDALLPDPAQKRNTEREKGERISLKTEEGKQRLRAAAEHLIPSVLRQPTAPQANTDTAALAKRIKMKVGNHMELSEVVRNRTEVLRAERENRNNKKNYVEIEGEEKGFITTTLFDQNDRLEYPFSAVGIVVRFSVVPVDGGIGKRGFDLDEVEEYMRIDAICVGSVIGPNLVITDDNCARGGLDKRGGGRETYVSFFPGWKWDFDLNELFDDLPAPRKRGFPFIFLLLQSGMLSGTSLGQWDVIASVSGRTDYALLVVDPKHELKNDQPLTYDLASVTGSFGIALDRPVDMVSFVGINFASLEPGMMVSTSTPISVDVEGDDVIRATYFTDIAGVGLPAIINLGTSTPGYTDYGYINGGVPQRNVISGILSNRFFGGDTKRGIFGDLVSDLSHFERSEFLDLYTTIEDDYCFAAGERDNANDDDVLTLTSTPTSEDMPAHPFDLNKQPVPADYYFSPFPLKRNTKQMRGKLPIATLTRKGFSKKSLRKFSIEVPEELHAEFATTPTEKENRAKKNYLVQDVYFSSTPIITQRDRLNYPMTAIGLVATYRVEDGERTLETTCTGTVIGPRLVLADPECLSPDPTEPDAWAWEFYPAWQRYSFSSGVLQGTALGMYEGEAAYFNVDYYLGRFSRRAGILVVERSTSDRSPWKYYNLGEVTGWLGLDLDEFETVADAEEVVMQAAYSESHFPGRIQLVMGEKSTVPHTVTAIDNVTQVPVVGYSTDMFATRSIPAIANPAPSFRSYLDVGVIAGEYAEPNIVFALLGIQSDELDAGSVSNVEGAIWGEVFGEWFEDLLDEACSNHCGACPTIADFFYFSLFGSARVPVKDQDLQVFPWWFFL